MSAQGIATCPAQDGDLSGLAGVVRDSAASVIIPGARVRAAWDEDGARRSRSTDSDDGGVYLLCGLPTLRPLEIQAMFGAFSTTPLVVQLEPGPPAGWDFVLAIAQGVATGGDRFPGRIVGRVVDRASGRPLESAEVSLVGDDVRRLTDGSGRFLFEDLTPGPYRVALHHLAYEPMEQAVDVPGNRTVEVDFEASADPIELEPIAVSVVRDRRLETRGFYVRRDLGEKLGNGVFLTSEDIRELNPVRVTSVLEYVPGVRVQCPGGPRNCAVYMTGGRPSLSGRAQSGCQNANVYIDGVRVIRDNQSMVESIDTFVLPSEIAGMEVYRGAGEIPAEFGGSVGQCGAIVIWTAAGRGS